MLCCYCMDVLIVHCAFHNMRAAVGSRAQQIVCRCRIPVTRNHLHQVLDHVVLQAHLNEGKGLVRLRIRDELEALGTSLRLWRTWYPVCIKLHLSSLSPGPARAPTLVALRPSRAISSSPLLRQPVDIHVKGPAEDDQPLVYQSTGSRLEEISGYLDCAPNKFGQHRLGVGTTSPPDNRPASPSNLPLTR